MSSYIPISEAIAIVARRRGLPVDREGRCDPAWQLILTEARCGELKMRYRGERGASPVQPALLNYVAALGGAASTYPIQETVGIDTVEAFRGGIEPPIPNHFPGLTVNRAQLDALWPEPRSSLPLTDQLDMAPPTLWTWNKALAWHFWRDPVRAANPPMRPSVAARYPKVDSDGNYPPVYGTVAEFQRAVDDGLLTQPEPGLFDAAQVMRVFPAPADRIAAQTAAPNAALVWEQELLHDEAFARAGGITEPIEERAPPAGEQSAIRETESCGISAGDKAGIRTTKAARAEEECGRLIAAMSIRPASKKAACTELTEAVAHLGPLSGKAFERQWGINAPPEWKRGGRRKKSPPAEI
jgi:hypothetical protein